MVREATDVGSQNGVIVGGGTRRASKASGIVNRSKVETLGCLTTDPAVPRYVNLKPSEPTLSHGSLTEAVESLDPLVIFQNASLGSESGYDPPDSPHHSSGEDSEHEVAGVIEPRVHEE
jgi:hypothetical protein